MLSSVSARLFKDTGIYAWKVARASTATPTYFSPMMGDDGEKYWSAMEGYFHLDIGATLFYKHLKTNDSKELSIFVSIGACEQSNKPARLLGKIGEFRYPMEWSAQDELEMRSLAIESKVEYVRLDAKGKPMTDAFDEWQGKHGSETISRIQAITEEYIQQAEVQEMLEKTARRLVDIRRKRATDSKRWADYCN